MSLKEPVGHCPDSSPAVKPGGGFILAQMPSDHSGLSVALKSVPVKQSSIILLAPDRGRLAAIPPHQAAADWTAPLLRRLPPPASHERAARDAEQRRNPRGVERTELGVRDKL